MDREDASKLNLLECILSDEASEPTNLPISLLEKITENFSYQIGSGGFATVYKGILPNGRAVVVKKISGSIDLDEAQYIHEIRCLMRIKHKNIVRFLGYCNDTPVKCVNYEGKLTLADVPQRLLCFEFLSNGSLCLHIADASHGLEWIERYKILKGICEGLCHLHELRIVHLDLKPANILLDDNMAPKISDFGLSRCFDENQTRTLTSYGSLGYCAPESYSGIITFKSDIYSLGVIFTEILTGQRVYSPVDDILHNWRKRFDISSADDLLEQVRVCTEISIECMNFNPSKRPVIQRIIERLEETERTDQFNIAGMSTSLMPQHTMEAPSSSSLGAMGPLLRKLGLLLAPECPLRRSVKHALELLKEDVEDISAALVEQSMEESPCNKAKYWMHQVRELSYDMEDCIDGMMQPYIARDANGRSVSKHIDHLDTARRKISRLRNTGFKIPQFSRKLEPPASGIARIAELRTLLREASGRYEKYQLDGCISSNPRLPFIGRSIKVPAKYNIAANIVGMEGSRDKLRKWLTDKEKHPLQVLAIIGPPGVGKTTLVRELYRELKGQFECRVFIRMSRKPDMSILLGEILSQLQRPKQSSIDAFSSVQNVIDNIRDHLQDKRYLIVLDHLWEAESWDIVHNAFPTGNNCSRIIITADVNMVPAQCCGHHSVNVSELQPLSSHDSEKLFINRIFGSEDICPDQLKELCRRILRKCGGLPLATITIAGLLACQPDNKDLWHHVMKCLSSILSNLTLEELLKEIVELCYSSLPQDLKTCLLYFTTYPEGYTIRKIDLIKQWIAEGFISPTEEKELVAESYFDELVNRGMIQPEQINRNNEVLSCSVHHIILDLIMSKCREDNFITEVDYSKTVTWFSRRARRLFLHLSCAQYATKPEGIRLSQVRSLSFFGLLRCMPSVMEFKVLRILILELWGDYDDCMSLDLSRIFRLFLLRYLKISSHIRVELPSQIRGLKFLETMEIHARVLTIPNDIVHLPGLLHLSIQDETKLPGRIGSITSLETLEYFDLGKNTEDNVRSLGELINLRDLHLTCSTALSEEHLKRNMEALASSLWRLGTLKSLTLAPSAVGMIMFIDHSRAIFSTPMFLQKLELSPPICIFYRLPEWIEKFQQLRILKIVVRVFLRSDIDILTGLSYLSVLSLYIRQPNAETVIFNNGSLPVLKYLKYTCGAFCIAFQEEALPSLQKMKLCFNIHRGGLYSDMVSGIEHLLNLNEIAVKVGAASDVEESDRRAAESVFERTLRKHPRFPIYLNIRRVDWIEEE